MLHDTRRGNLALILCVFLFAVPDVVQGRNVIVRTTPQGTVVELAESVSVQQDFRSGDSVTVSTTETNATGHEADKARSSSDQKSSDADKPSAQPKDPLREEAHLQKRKKLLEALTFDRRPSAILNVWATPLDRFLHQNMPEPKVNSNKPQQNTEESDQQRNDRLQADDVVVVSERHWTVTLRDRNEVALPGTQFTFPDIFVDSDEVIWQRYNDADLATVNQTISLLEAYDQPRTWLNAAIVVGIVGGGLLFGWIVLRRGSSPPNRLRFF